MRYQVQVVDEAGRVVSVLGHWSAQTVATVEGKLRPVVSLLARTFGLVEEARQIGATLGTPTKGSKRGNRRR
jgi:hypothetical protein